MSSLPAITLQTATQRDAPLLANLLDLYVYDLSDIFGIKIGNDGRFGYDKLPLYWSEPQSHHAYFIRVNTDLAGFALVARGSPASKDPNIFDMAEFFVLRTQRRFGVGARAAALLWDRHPGAWSVRVSEKNSAALPFWERTIARYTHGHFALKTYPGKSHMFTAYLFTSPQNGQRG